MNRIAPNMSSVLGQRLSESSPTVLDKLTVRKMLVVSTEARQVADGWLMTQFDPRKEAFDYDFADLASWDPNEAVTYLEIVFMISRDRLPNLDVLSAWIPGAMQSWLQSDDSKRERAISQQTVEGASGESRTIYSIIAPTLRHLQGVLAKRSVSNIPDSVDREAYQDLSGYKQTLVIARSQDPSLESLLGDCGGKMAAALADGTGLLCSSRPDLSDITYEWIGTGQDGRIDDSTLNTILAKSPEATALAVVRLENIDAATTYSVPASACLTAAYAAFSEPMSSEPNKPNASERKYGFVGPRIYPEGENDPKYRERYRQWKQ